MHRHFGLTPKKRGCAVNLELRHSLFLLPNFSPTPKKLVPIIGQQEILQNFLLVRFLL
jgi:hypothetical protein